MMGGCGFPPNWCIGVAWRGVLGRRFPGLRGEPPNPLTEPPGGHDPVGALLASGVLDDDPRRWAGMLRGLAGNGSQVAAGEQGSSGPMLLAEVVRPNTASDVAAKAPAPRWFVTANPLQWISKLSLGDGECVTLVKAATGAPQASG